MYVNPLDLDEDGGWHMSTVKSYKITASDTDVMQGKSRTAAPN